MSDPRTLPSTRHLLTALINTLATSTQQHDDQAHDHEQPPSSNPLLDASQTTKSTILTLHTLFPTDLLPALDLLDRGLVTRFVLATPSPEYDANHTQLQTEGQEKEQDLEHPPPTRKQTLVYYVRSSRSSHPSRSHHSSSRSASSTQPPTTAAAAATTHEIHLKAWNCSCPAFAFAAFPADLQDGLQERASATDNNGQDYDDDDDWYESTKATTEWQFGGLTRGDGSAVPPVCKHLLACVIAERCVSFAGLVEERQVGVEEVAGWAAGWGD